MKRKPKRTAMFLRSFKAAKTSTPISGVTVEDRTLRWEEASSVLTKETTEGSCPDIGDTSASPIYAVDKIGSDSRFGQVFKIGFRDHPNVFAALKIMPHVTYQTDKVNDQEIEFMRTVSNLVISGSSPFFPIIYGAGTCNDIKLAVPTGKSRKENPRSAELYIRANNWKLIKAMLQKYVPEEKYREAGKLFWDWDPYSVAARLSDAVEEDIEPIMGNLTAPVMGEIIFMELAWGDLKKYIDIKEDVRATGGRSFGGDPVIATGHGTDVSGLVKNVIRAIADLQMYAKLVHGDLHTGNVLIQMIQTDDWGLQPLPLLTDFGHSRKLDVTKPKERIYDVMFFMQSLGAQKSKLPVELGNKVETFNRMMFSTKPLNSSMEEVIYWWDHSFFDVSSSISAKPTDDVWSQFLT